MSRRERAVADRQICEQLTRIPGWRRARNIASFLAFDGEPSLEWLHADGQRADKRFFVPVIRAQRMRFAPLESNSPMARNMFGIREPRRRLRIDTRRLDIVLVSLVGFDSHGNRLGMGGGYYDRHFSYLRNLRLYARPRLIGVAYAFQEVPQLPQDVWDVPLWGVVTNRGFHRF